MKTAVVGAGIAGIRVATLLNEKGWKTYLVEEHKDVKEGKVCSGLISRKTFGELDIGPEKIVLNTLHGARIYSPSGNMIEINKKRAAVVVDRGKLDRELVKKYRGERLFEYKALSYRNNNLFLRHKKGSGRMIKADFVVDASGPLGTFRELVLPKKIPMENFVHAYQARYKGMFNKNYVEIYLNNIAKGFFAWVTPESRDRAKIGIGVLLGLDPKERFNQFVETYNLSLGKKLGDESAVIPVGEPIRKPIKRNIALVGDSAFQTKASSGGGIGFSLRGANALADAIDKEIRKKARAEVTYAKNLSPIVKQLELHWKVRKFYNSLNETQLEKLFQKLKNVRIEEFVEKYGDMEEIDRLLSIANPRLLPLLPEFIKFKII